MANAYGSDTFTIDTSTNVAGLTALKGSPSDTGDTIVVTGAAVLSVDAPLACASIIGAYTIVVGELRVAPSAATEGLCTLEQVKERIGLTTTDSDATIATLIAALTPIANVRYGREFMQTGSSKRTFMVRNNRIDLAPFDLRTVSGVILHPEAETPQVLTANVDYALVGAGSLTSAYSILRLANGASISSTFASRFGTAQVEITGAWGLWATTADVPLDINQAAVECIVSLMNRPSATVANVSSGGAREIAPAIPNTWDFPFSAHVKFQPYSRNFGVY